MSDVLVVDGVWKGYRDLAHGHRTLRGSLIGGDFVRRLRAPLKWALRDVSLRLPAGESIGVVGRNGAGKSTLLRLVSNLGRPTRGGVAVHPDLASVLNLGASFDPQMTGRENAMTACLVAGMTAREARERVLELLRFAELEEVAEAPIRTYSEGMRLRLAFGAVAVQRPALLVVDEVLAVGDVAFRRKCQDRIAELRAGGTSLVLASHSAQEVLDTCRRAVWLDRGAVAAAGDAAEVLARYEAAAHAETLARTPPGLPEQRIGSQEIRVRRVLVDGSERAVAPVRAGARVEVVIEIEAAGGPVRRPIVGVHLRRAGSSAPVLELFSANSGVSLGDAVRRAVVSLRLDRLDLARGAYELSVGLYERDWAFAYDYLEPAVTLDVSAELSAGEGVLLPPVRWRVLEAE